MVFFDTKGVIVGIVIVLLIICVILINYVIQLIIEIRRNKNGKKRKS